MPGRTTDSESLIAVVEVAKPPVVLLTPISMAHLNMALPIPVGSLVNLLTA